MGWLGFGRRPELPLKPSTFSGVRRDRPVCPENASPEESFIGAPPMKATLSLGQEHHALPPGSPGLSQHLTDATLGPDRVTSSLALIRGHLPDRQCDTADECLRSSGVCAYVVPELRVVLWGMWSSGVAGV